MKVDRSRVPVVYNGVRLAEFSGEHCQPEDGNGPLVIGTAARFSPEKALDQLLRAVALLKERGHEFKTRIAGNGSL